MTDIAKFSASRFGVEPNASVFSPKSPRNYKYSIADMLVKTTGTIAMVTVKEVSFLKTKYGYTRNGHIALYCQTLTSDKEGRRKHNMWWSAKDPHYSGRLWQSKSIMASCDCEYFKYFCEYAWWYRGLADIIHSNGAPPLITNPRLKLFCCKHLLRSGLTIVSKKY